MATSPLAEKAVFEDMSDGDTLVGIKGGVVGRFENMKANILMGLGAAKVVLAGATSARVQLAVSGISGISITAVDADVRFALGNGSINATSTSHYLAKGQSRDFRVEPGQYLAAIRAGSENGSVEITELLA